MHGKCYLSFGLILSPVRKCGSFMVLNQIVGGVNDQQNPLIPD